MPIIPYQGLTGGYNWRGPWHEDDDYYTIPRIDRGLQHYFGERRTVLYYTIPRINRGLQRRRAGISPPQDYTIPRINRGLQRRRAGISPPQDYTIPRINRSLNRSGLSETIRFALCQSLVLEGNRNCSISVSRILFRSIAYRHRFPTSVAESLRL